MSKRPQASTHSEISPRTDPIISRVHDWMSAKELQDALVRDWQDTENNLSWKIKPLGIRLNQATRGQLPEAERMRCLMRRIRALDQKLGREARCIAEMKAASAIGALAKIEMARRLWRPNEKDEDVWMLLSSGVEQLTELLER